MCAGLQVSVTGSASKSNKTCHSSGTSPEEPGTVSYFLLDTSAQTVQRIVAHPLIEDTAFINRGTFALENAPAARTWLGHRFTTLWPFVLLYVSLFGCLIAGAELTLG